MTDDEILAQQMMQPARDTMAREELRDKFAMAALSALADKLDMSDFCTEWGRISIRAVTAESYAIADAMLEARKAKP